MEKTHGIQVQSVLWLSGTQGLTCKLWLLLPLVTVPQRLPGCQGLIRLALFPGTRKEANGDNSWSEWLETNAAAPKTLPRMHSGARVAGLAAPSPRMSRCGYSAEIHGKDSGLWRLQVVLTSFYTTRLLFSCTHLHTGSLTQTLTHTKNSIKIPKSSMWYRLTLGLK